MYKLDTIRGQPYIIDICSHEEYIEIIKILEIQWLEDYYLIESRNNREILGILLDKNDYIRDKDSFDYYPKYKHISFQDFIRDNTPLTLKDNYKIY